MSYERKPMGWFMPPGAAGAPSEAPLPPPQPAYGTAPAGSLVAVSTGSSGLTPLPPVNTMTPSQAKTFLGINVGILGLVALGGIAAMYFIKK